MTAAEMTDGAQLPGRIDLIRAVQAMVGLLGIAIITLMISLVVGYDEQSLYMISLAILTSVVALLPACIDFARVPEERHLLFSFYCGLFVIHYGLPIFTQYAGAVGAVDPAGVSGAGLMPPSVIEGQVVALIGLLALIAGYGLTQIPGSISASITEARRDWSPNTVVMVGIAMLMLGAPITFAGFLGIIPASVGSGFISTLGSAVLYGNVLLTVAVWRHGSRLARSILIVAVPVSMAVGFGTGSKRSTLMLPALMVLTTMVLGGRLRFRWVLAGFGALVVLYPAAQFYRDVILQANTLTLADAVSDIGYVSGALWDFITNSAGNNSRYLEQGLNATAGRLDAIGIESVIVRDTPVRSPFQDGRTLILFFYAFVPRLFWADKPEITLGQWITDVYGSGTHVTSYTAPSFIGDLYLNFGMTSVILGMLILGFLFRLFHHLVLGPKATAAGVLAAIIVVMQIHTKQQGPVAYTLSSTIFALVPLLFVALLVNFFGRNGAAVGGDASRADGRAGSSSGL